MASKKMKSYQVQARCVRWVAVEVIAENLERALEKSKSLSEDTFVKVHGDCIDGDTRITGVYESFTQD